MGAFDHLFGPGRGGGCKKKKFQKFKCPGSYPGGGGGGGGEVGMLKPRFDWYISSCFFFSGLRPL